VLCRWSRASSTWPGERNNNIKLNCHPNVVIGGRRLLINKKILTIGGADFIGFNVARSLILGDTSEVPLRNIMLPKPLSQYAVTKLASEHYLNIFGPGQGPSSEYAAVIPGSSKLSWKGDSVDLKRPEAGDYKSLLADISRAEGDASVQAPGRDGTCISH